MALGSLDRIIPEFSLGQKPVVGLSIGSSSIKMVELSKKGKLWKLMHFGVVQLPEDVMVNREIANPVALIECIKTLSNQMNLSKRAVCASISGNALIVKRMTLDGVNRRELQDQVFWEAEQYLPFDVSEVAMDFHLVSHSKEGKAEVVLVAVKKAVLETYMDCISKAGLKPSIMDTDFFALQNTYEVNYPAQSGQAVALVDLGASSLKISIITDGVPVFTKDSALGGQLLTSEIQNSLGLSFADAEALKTGQGKEGIPQEVLDLMSSMAENIGVEIKKGLDFYLASSSGPPVGAVLLAGGGAKLAGLSQTVEGMIGLPTQLLNPFNAITYSSDVFTPDYVSRIESVAAVPIGLAIRAGGD